MPGLLQPNQPELLRQDDQNVFVGKVIYGCDETCRQHRRTVEKLADIVDRTSRANRQLVCGKLGHPWFDAMNRAALTHQIIWNSLTARAASFANERETRYVLVGEAAVFDPFRKKCGNRRYVETPLPLAEPGNITEIIVGPDASRGAEDMVGDLLRNNGYPDDIPIYRSRASVKSAGGRPQRVGRDNVE